MNVSIICVGKLKEKYLKDAAAEYEKRLSRYCRLKIAEVDDGPDMAAEAARMMKRLDRTSYIITLEIGGRQLSSQEFADSLEKLGIGGVSDITFIIGGPEGLDESIIKLAKEHLSFSKMTFTHQMMRVILLEQIYRGYRIINGEPYHK